MDRFFQSLIGAGIGISLFILLSGKFDKTGYENVEKPKIETIKPIGNLDYNNGKSKIQMMEVRGEHLICMVAVHSAQTNISIYATMGCVPK